MKQRIGIAALLAAGVVAGPVVSDAHAQSSATIVATSTPFTVPPNTVQYINQWSPAGGLSVTAGGTVTFTNPSVLPHTVFFGDEPGRNLPSGASETFTAPSTPGPVQYLCTLHNGMIGVLNVVAAPTPTPKPTPTPTPTPTPNPAPITPAQTVTPATSLVSDLSTSRRTWKVTVRFQLSADATVTARLKTRNGTRTLKKVTRDLEAGRRSVTINRSFTGGARYRVLLQIVDDAGNVQNRTVNFTGAYR
jgi:plastocyanin